MKIVKCSSCGASVSYHDPSCSYCDTANPEYQAPGEEVNALLEKAMDAYQHERYAMAIDHYNRAIALDPYVFSAYFYLAACLTVLGRRREAIRAMQSAQGIRPGNSPIYVNLGLLYKQEGDKDAARKYLEKALKMVDSDSSVNNHEQLKQHIRKEMGGLKRWGLF